MPSFDDATIEEWRASRVLDRFDPKRWEGTPTEMLRSYIGNVIDVDITEEWRRLRAAEAQVKTSSAALKALRKKRQDMVAFVEVKR